MNEAKRFAPAAERNAEPIMCAMSELLPQRGKVLELASGTGQHAVQFARRFGELNWQPSDVNPISIASIQAYVDEAKLTNLCSPILLDVRQPSWGCGRFDALVATNLVHISPWSVTLGLFAGAMQHLEESGLVIMYGPFRFFGAFNAPSNQRFDEQLRGQNPEWGIRDLDELGRAARAQNFLLDSMIPMPANNHILVFRRALMD